jgi:hypothetical protein
MRRILLAATVLVLLLGMLPTASAQGTLYVDDDNVCGGNSPCYTTVQAAINAASDYDTILVYPGTYDPQIEVTPPCWGGHYYAQGIVAWKSGLTIQAVDPDPANTVIESTFPGWMQNWRIQILTGGTYGLPPNCFPITGGYDPVTSAAPSAVMVVKDGVTIDGFTIRSTYIGDPGQTGHPNSAGVMIGGVKAGDTTVDGVDGTTIQNCVISGWSAVYNWKSSNTTLDSNVMTNIQTTTAPMGSTVNSWGGWDEGDCSRSATGMRLLDNTITSIAVEHAVFLGGYCNGWIDNSDLYIDGNTIVSPACGVCLWQSGGTNKVMTCNNTVTAPWGGICVWDSTYDGPYGIDTEGPTTDDVLAGPNPVAAGQPVHVTALVDDSTTGGSNIAAASYSIDAGPDVAMSAGDGAFDEISEDVEATFSSPSTAGIYNYTLCVKGTDVCGNTGGEECIELMLVVYDPDGGFVTGGGWIDSPPGALGPATHYYGDWILDSPWWNTSFPERWNLAACDLNMSFDLDMSQMGAGWVPIEVGLKEPTAPNIDPNDRGGWMLSMPQYAGATDPSSLDDDDHFLLVDHGWASDESDYDVYPDGSIALTPFGTFNTAGFWFDRDGVDQYQAQQWDMCQNGTAHDTGGQYAIQVGYAYSADSAKGTMFATINEGQQGIYTSGWQNAEPDIFPAGKSFSVADFSDLRVFIGGGNISGQAQISNLTVTGCPNVTGKASFGFVSKYKKGASVPEGNTEFVFKAAGLNFHSTAYDWLVVNQGGTRAQFKGSGTINGTGDYKFMLWAGDGEPDTFHIKIWSEENGSEVVVYDNDTDQAIGGGSIVVHTK